MLLNSATRERNICAAILRDSGDSSEDAIRLSSAQTKPSANACQKARLPFNVRPQDVHSESSGKKPIRRVIQSSKYVSGIHNAVPRSSCKTDNVRRKTASLASW